jgi:electron transfer flavoprotein alpha/beta subunit
MKIAVGIKQVPTREWQPRLNDDKTWVRDQDVSYEMNEPDAYALEEALRLREKHDRWCHRRHDLRNAASRTVCRNARQ